MLKFAGRLPVQRDAHWGGQDVMRAGLGAEKLSEARENAPRDTFQITYVVLGTSYEITDKCEYLGTILN
jgi:hypothetical protein